MKFFLVLLLIAIPAVFAQVNAGCDCTTDFGCGCCVTQIPLINSICVNITWSPGLSYANVDLDVNGVSVWEAQIDGNGPIEQCFAVTVVDVCLSLEDLDISTQGACGNVYVNVTGFGLEFDWDLGQFQLGQCASRIPQLRPLPPVIATPLFKASKKSFKFAKN